MKSQKPMRSGVCSDKPSAFSLLELLVVVAIMAILLTLGAASTSSVLRSVKLNQAATIVTTQFSLARQMAVSKNLPVDVRLIRALGEERPFSRIQLFQNGIPVTRAEAFPEMVGISPRRELTSFVDAGAERNASAANDPPLSGLGHDYRFVEFRFHPKGNLGLDITEKWFATVAPETPDTLTPENFVTVQIDPVTGGLEVYRP